MRLWQLSVLSLGLWAGCQDKSRHVTTDGGCRARVTGSGLVPIETQYLPRVVACENGPAADEALKAQAVAARSYLYYTLARQGYIDDGQRDQVYTCANEPTDRHRAAVAATKAEILTYKDTIVAGFYVAGAAPDGDCIGGDEDPTDTEAYVTYNRGRNGHKIDQSPIGYVAPHNLANRGCKSQNGAHCLAMGGEKYAGILRYYYGDDITLTKVRQCPKPSLTAASR